MARQKILKISPSKLLQAVKHLKKIEEQKP